MHVKSKKVTLDHQLMLISPWDHLQFQSPSLSSPPPHTFNFSLLLSVLPPFNIFFVWFVTSAFVFFFPPFLTCNSLFCRLFVTWRWFTVGWLCVCVVTVGVSRFGQHSHLHSTVSKDTAGCPGDGCPCQRGSQRQRHHVPSDPYPASTASSTTTFPSATASTFHFLWL